MTKSGIQQFICGLAAEPSLDLTKELINSQGPSTFTVIETKDSRFAVSGAIPLRNKLIFAECFVDKMDLNFTFVQIRTSIRKFIFAGMRKKSQHWDTYEAS